MRLGEIRPESQNPIVLRRSLIKPALHRENVAKVVVRRDEIGRRRSARSSMRITASSSLFAFVRAIELPAEL